MRQRQLEQARVVADLAGRDQVGALLGLVLDVDVGASVDQRAGDVEMVAVGGGDERGRATGVARMYVGFAVEQSADSVAVSIPGGCDQLAIASD